MRSKGKKTCYKAKTGKSASTAARAATKRGHDSGKLGGGYVLRYDKAASMRHKKDMFAKYKIRTKK